MSNENGLCKQHSGVCRDIAGLGKSLDKLKDEHRQVWEVMGTRVHFRYFIFLAAVLLSSFAFTWMAFQMLSAKLETLDTRFTARISLIDKNAAVRDQKLQSILDAVREVKEKMK